MANQSVVMIDETDQTIFAFFFIIIIVLLMLLSSTSPIRWCERLANDTSKFIFVNIDTRNRSVHYASGVLVLHRPTPVGYLIIFFFYGPSRGNLYYCVYNFYYLHRGFYRGGSYHVLYNKLTVYVCLNWSHVIIVIFVDLTC
jgi:hypothetical protein